MKHFFPERNMQVLEKVFHFSLVMPKTTSLWASMPSHAFLWLAEEEMEEVVEDQKTSSLGVFLGPAKSLSSLSVFSLWLLQWKKARERERARDELWSFYEPSLNSQMFFSPSSSTVFLLRAYWRPQLPNGRWPVNSLVRWNPKTWDICFCASCLCNVSLANILSSRTRIFYSCNVHCIQSMCVYYVCGFVMEKTGDYIGGVSLSWSEGFSRGATPSSSNT